MKVYIAGPMSGLPGYNFKSFDVAAEIMRAQGHEVFSPVERDRDLYGVVVDATPEMVDRRRALTEDLEWIGAHAEAVALLPGWEHSEGAKIEEAFAKTIGLSIIHLEHEKLLELHRTNVLAREETRDFNLGEFCTWSEHNWPTGKKVRVRTDTSRPDLLQTREKTHGNFADNAQYSQRIKAIAETTRESRTHIQNESFDMIALKLSRILSGQAGHKDHWDDIAGYAQLAAEEINNGKT